MKQLLYIPHGTFLTFYVGQDKNNKSQFKSIEEHKGRYQDSYTEIIDFILNGKYDEDFYERNNIPDFRNLELAHFELVDSEQE